METAPLKSYATWARTELIKEVGARIAAVLAPGSTERVEEAPAVKALEAAVKAAGGEAAGRAKVADKVAYTWFNRIIALRFMDANGYTVIGVVSPHRGQTSGQPEVLADAKRGVIDTDVVGKRAADTITALLDGTRRSSDPQGEAYSVLLADYCRYWHRSMPFIFEREGDYTELLIPANLLADDSVVARSVAVLTEEVCQDVEIIGWLYQFYISERKDEVFAGFKKNKKAGADEIPAATQLFTPHWIVRYLVENSLGRLWMLNHPDSRLVDQMDYYISPIDEETDFLKITKAEELTVIDPACGSGHMLTYAFDLLYAIYEEEGYTPSQIPGLILTHNLYGTEIDHRAGALAAFALTMKAAAKRKVFLKDPVEPNVCVLDPISFSADELSYLVTKGGDRHAEEAFWNQFAEADTFGSLIQPDPVLTARLAEHLATIDDRGDLLRADALSWAQRVITQAAYLTGDYAVVVANPPYMGSKQMNALLSQFMKDEYPTGKADLMTAFMLKSQILTKPGGVWGMINLPSWMSLKSFAELRYDLLLDQRLVSMVHLGRGVFGSDFGSAAFVVANAKGDGGRAVYRRLFEQHVDVRSVATIEALFLDRDYNRFEVAQSDFAAIPGSPVVYWLSEKMRAAFQSGATLADVVTTREGLTTGDNNRFLKFWWEPSVCGVALPQSFDDAPLRGKRWFAYLKGGTERCWSGNFEYVVDWERDGERQRLNIEEQNGRVRSHNYNGDWAFRAGITWTGLTSGRFCGRAMGKGFMFDTKGPVAFPHDGRARDYLLSILNSSVGTTLLKMLAPTMDFKLGQVEKLPLPAVTPDRADQLSARCEALIATAVSDWDAAETAWDFAENPLVTIAKHLNL
jgi:hypothetical protein